MLVDNFFKMIISKLRVQDILAIVFCTIRHFFVLSDCWNFCLGFLFWGCQGFTNTCISCTYAMLACLSAASRACARSARDRSTEYASITAEGASARNVNAEQMTASA
jgi:hypothetical protein